MSWWCGSPKSSSSSKTRLEGVIARLAEEHQHFAEEQRRENAELRAFIREVAALVERFVRGPRDGQP